MSKPPHRSISCTTDDTNPALSLSFTHHLLSHFFSLYSIFISLNLFLITVLPIKCRQHAPFFLSLCSFCSLYLSFVSVSTS
ncbi:hypothetical protein V8C35DRAFT_294355 [Trichoderma chlorosporum]